MIHNPTIYNNTDWVRPADWLPIDHLVSDGEQKVVGLFAVFPSTETYYHNKICVKIRRAYWVDWGDGSPEEAFADTTIAEHEYDYDTISNSTLCSRGYKQVIVTMRPQGVGSTDMYQVYLGQKHSSSTENVDTSNWLDLKICGTGISTLSTLGVRFKLLEKMYIYQSANTLITLQYLCGYADRLAYFDAEGLNVSNVQNFGYVFHSCKSIKYFGIKSWVPTQVIACEGMFKFAVIPEIDLSNFSTPVGSLCYCGSMFYCCSTRKITLGSFNINYVGSMYYLCSVAEIDDSLSTYTNITTLVSFIQGDYWDCNLYNYDFTKIPLNQVTTMASVLVNQRNFKRAEFTNGTLTNLTVAPVLFTLIAGYCNVDYLRMNQLCLSVSVVNSKIAGSNMNLLFGDLADLNGAINAISTANAGTGYSVGDLITLSAGNNNAVIEVVTIGAGGSYASGRWSHRGTGYSVVSNIASTSPVGTGYRANILTIKATQTITITGTPAASDVLTDRTIATAKNWTVVG